MKHTLYDHHRDYAKRLMRHYFSYVWQRADCQWDYDNTAEVEALVDHIIEAAVAKLVQMQNEVTS